MTSVRFLLWLPFYLHLFLYFFFGDLVITCYLSLSILGLLDFIFFIFFYSFLSYFSLTLSVSYYFFFWNGWALPLSFFHFVDWMVDVLVVSPLFFTFLSLSYFISSFFYFFISIVFYLLFFFLILVQDPFF